MKRVGILTLYYKTYNFGAQLQTYALQKTIEKLGYKCEQISFIWAKEEVMQGYENASIDQNSFSKFAMSIPHSIRAYNSNDIYECLNDYDVFICGSDQVWGVENSMPLYKLPIMSLSFVPDYKVKFSYAASLGGATASYKIGELLKQTLPRLDAISVREKSAIPYLEEISGAEVESVLDPVMLLSDEELDLLAGDRKARSPYIFYYTIGMNHHLEELVEKVALEKNLEIERAGYIKGQKIGPEDFIRLIRDADYVITDSFHATVISIMYHKQFLTTPIDQVPTERSRNTRLIDLMEICGLEQRYLKSYNNPDFNVHALELLDANIDYNKVEIRLKNIRDRSINFLVNNIEIEKKKNNFLKSHDSCTGCGVCSLSCPQGCISMEKDAMGFVYPKTDDEKCTYCGICKKVCNKINMQDDDFNTKALALISKKNEVRTKSSSGGAFYEIASSILKDGGKVFGCTFSDCFQVKHDLCKSINELDEYCRSKYVQSNAYRVFKEIKEELTRGQKVLFVGTPCQTHALTSYIGDIPDNLYRIDLVCGGVTAPALWDMYLKHIQEEAPVKSISMRYKYSEYLKEEGFPAFSMNIQYESHDLIIPGEDDLFLGSRFSFYRDCCYQCEYKGLNRDSDITIGDFCGMKKLIPSFYDGKGTTLAFVHTMKGKELLSNCISELQQITLEDLSLDDLLAKNIMVSGQMKHKAQHEFMRALLPLGSIERIYYENRYVDEFVNRQNTQKNLYIEIIRDELLKKLMKFQYCKLNIEDCPDIVGDIFIYGAGKLGRAILQCMHSEPIGFIDENPLLNNCCGIRVYHLDTEEVKTIFSGSKKKTVIVTPVWDIDIVGENIMQQFPKVNIVSLKKVVGDIWL